MGVWINNSDGVTPAIGKVSLLNSLMRFKMLKKMHNRNENVSGHLYLYTLVLASRILSVS